MKSLMILAQGRSGSTFFSSWFGSHSQVTYFIEPCSMVYLKPKAGKHYDRTGVECNEVLNKLFNCDFSAADLDRNQTAFIPEQAAGFKGWGHQRDTDPDECKTREMVVVKELRVGMAWAENKIQYDKVIVLFRDPRAIRSSRAVDWPEPTKGKDWVPNPFGWNGASGFPYKQSLQGLCIEHLALRNKVASDPIKYLGVDYADVLEDPVRHLKQAMEFAGLELLPQVLEHVQKNVNGTCEHVDKPFSVCRKNPPKKDDKWKTQLKKEHLNELLAIGECHQLIDKYYPDVADEKQNTDEL